MDKKKTMKITGVIFDFGGVLLKWKPQKILSRHFADQPLASEAFLKEINFMEWNAQQDKGRSFSEGVALLSKEYPHYSHIIRAFQDNWEDSIDGLIEESIELLEKLKEMGLSIYGLSNWSAETFPVVRKRYKFFDLFDGIIISGEVKLIKPDPAIFYLCLSRMGRPANECLFIDDSEANILAAKTIGFDTIHFKSPGQLRIELQDRGLL